MSVARPRALVRRPGPRLADGIVTHRNREHVDLTLATKQWESYVEAVQLHGWDVIEVPPLDDCADAVFVEDTIVVYKNTAVIAHPGAETRRPETREVERVVASLGYSINHITTPGTLDG